MYLVQYAIELKRDNSWINASQTWCTWSDVLNFIIISLVQSSAGHELPNFDPSFIRNARFHKMDFHFKSVIWHKDLNHKEVNLSVDKKNQLAVTFCILYFSSNSCSTCFGQPCAHHQELTTV